MTSLPSTLMRLATGLVALAAASACSAQPPTPAAVAASQPVPAIAPDTQPAWILAESNLVRDGASFPFYADVIAVRFALGTAQAERQAAIDAVKGVVVGGSRRDDGDGIYYVRIGALREIRPLTEAVRLLLGLPQVSAASFVTPGE